MPRKNKRYDSDDEKDVKSLVEETSNKKDNKKDNKKEKKKDKKKDKTLDSEKPLTKELTPEEESVKEIDNLIFDYQPNTKPSVDNIIVEKLSLFVNKKQLLKETTLKLLPKSRYGLIGHNGSGKSSLLKIIPFLPISKNLKITQIQQTFIPSDETVFITVMKMNPQVYQLKTQLEELYTLEEDNEKLTELEEKWDEINGEKQEMIIKKILFGLGFTEITSNQPTNSFSGGWQRRIELAKMLYLQPDILLLDEPTNHLDLEGVLWLINYLQDYPKILLTTSHSVEFLNQVCNQTIFLENLELRQYKGNYYQAKDLRDLDEKKLKQDHEKLKKKIEEMKNKSKTNQEKEEEIKKANLKALVPRYLVKFPKYQSSEIKSTLIKFEEVNFGYNEDNLIFENLTLEIKQSSRITLVGRNGIGKSTLLKLMKEELVPKTGSIISHSGLRIGYYHQHFDTMLPETETPVSYLEKLLPANLDFRKNPILSIRQYLGELKLDSTSHIKEIGTLSGGEKARVSWLAMIFQQPHLILLDEPTNHLDLETVEAMIESLMKFNGGIVMVTHDPTLITQLESEIFLVENKNITKFEGDLEDLIPN
jgi:ATP-binding cassette subfamily F protein 1